MLIAFSLDLGSTKIKKLYFQFLVAGVQKSKKELFPCGFATFRASLFEKHYAAKRVGVKKRIVSPGRDNQFLK